MHLVNIRGTLASCVFLTFLLSLATVSAQSGGANSWIKPASGNWDDPTGWSLGVLPNSSQSVLITNQGWKAVAINPSTPILFPDSMTVDTLTVEGAWDTMNTLLLNYAGTATPLRVLNGLNIGSNGTVLMLYSGLNFSNTLNLNGVLDQEGGELTFTNSLSTIMQIEGGQFTLTNGVVNGANMYLGGADAGFANQESGLVSLNWLGLGTKPTVPGSPGNGTYLLQSGWLIVSSVELVGENGFGTLTQNDGTNSVNLISIADGTYVKNGGGLFAGDVDVSNAANLTHAGGAATVTNLVRLNGQQFGGTKFNMLGGSLSTPRIELVSSGEFTQSNGTVNVASELFNQTGRGPSSSYYLSGGNLFSARTTISSYSARFLQSGGTHIVTNQLWINGTSALYQMSGGTLNARDIMFTGNLPNPPQFWIQNAPPFTITNQNISLMGGAIVIENSAQQFGHLTVPSDCLVNLSGDSAILRFADSHTNNWGSELQGVVPKLLVYNWNGSTNGAGTDQLVFGSNSSALTASQLAQIRFVNPAGFPSGSYQSRILSTGEVVPDQQTGASITFSRQGNDLVLTWPSGWILQSASNVAGPYSDVPGAGSPYSYNMTQGSQQFFRLRQ